MEIILDDVFYLVVFILIVSIIIFLLTLSTFIYLGEDRKKLCKEIEKKQHDYNSLFDRYYSCMVNIESLKTKVYFYENFKISEGENDE